MELTSESQNEVDNAEEIKNLKKVEAALFISGRFLSLQELVALTEINPLLLRELIEKLIGKYDDSCAIEVLQKEDRWKMDVKQEYRNMVNKLATGTAEFTKAEQETLAIIAYKQPVKQSVIIKIRGNKAYDHVKNFIEMGLVRGKKIGHTKELSLSDEFYDYFTLRNSGEVSDDHRNSVEFLEVGKGEKEVVERKEVVESIKEEEKQKEIEDKEEKGPVEKELAIETEEQEDKSILENNNP